MNAGASRLPPFPGIEAPAVSTPLQPRFAVTLLYHCDIIDFGGTHAVQLAFDSTELNWRSFSATWFLMLTGAS
jgi:hypothetical protein